MDFYYSQLLFVLPSYQPFQEHMSLQHLPQKPQQTRWTPRCSQNLPDFSRCLLGFILLTLSIEEEWRRDCVTLYDVSGVQFKKNKMNTHAAQKQGQVEGLPWWLTANAGEVGLLLCQEDPQRRKWQLAPVFLPGIPYTREPGGLQSVGSQRVGHDLATTQILSDSPEWAYCAKGSVLSEWGNHFSIWSQVTDGDIGKAARDVRKPISATLVNSMLEGWPPPPDPTATDTGRAKDRGPQVSLQPFLGRRLWCSAVPSLEAAAINPGLFTSTVVCPGSCFHVPANHLLNQQRALAALLSRRALHEPKSVKLR